MPTGIFWLASYPKSGNTWLRSFIFAMQNQSKADLTTIDINQLHTGAIASSRDWLANGLGVELGSHSVEQIESYRSDAYRFIHSQLAKPAYHKIHDANHMCASGQRLCPLDACAGALYVVRNPFDVAISFANHMGVSLDRSIEMMGTPDFALLANDKKYRLQVRQRMGTWSDHVTSWVDSDLPILLVRYEDMLSNSLVSFTKVSQFLHLPDDAHSVKNAIAMCHFNNLKKQEDKHGFKERPVKSKAFFRKGIVGDWQDTLSQSQIDRLIIDHAAVMQRLGYLDDKMQIMPLCYPKKM
ncbi:sulfotransferase domain-containing protein [Shewanella sp. SP1S2-4]|uniref:sulfotransferase domain-containing protein n=1 Tax=Shewanella TaxID=22 RepID=UPI00288E932E|nr:sulfotransferase domain-containing protein [Shewanella sp. SP1S2-4]MDT3322212.1 sulfotransferase domain-containing protein [Shewanella sp. SP1S2-4]